MKARDALQGYFAANGFGVDGGYSSKWFKIGPRGFVVSLPNTRGHVEALKPHDLHHLVTGYVTTFVGEGEIAAWELAAGCRDFYVAWLLNLAAMGIGLLLAPARMWRAFRRGMRARSLYGADYDALLELDVEALRARCEDVRESSLAKDAGLFVLASIVGVVALVGTSLVAFPIGLPVSLAQRLRPV